MPAVVHLLGYPGTGKRTIGAALAAAVPRDERRFVVVDDHLTGNAVLAALDTDTLEPIDPRVWSYVHDIRAHVLAAIEDLAPPGWSYVRRVSSRTSTRPHAGISPRKAKRSRRAPSSSPKLSAE